MQKLGDRQFEPNDHSASMKVFLVLVSTIISVSANATGGNSDALVTVIEVTSNSQQDDEKYFTSKVPDLSEDDSHLFPTPEEKKGCSIGRFVNGKFQNPEYDLLKILTKFGGPPGKVNVTRSKREDPPLKKEDLTKRPLPDADQKYWIYKYGDTDAKTYIRIEHAVHRFSGTSKAFLEVRGTLYFTPEDFCGKSRRAYYTIDDRGFTFEVPDEYCRIGNTVRCAPLAECKTDEHGRIGSCQAHTNALLATLVGGGK